MDESTNHTWTAIWLVWIVLSSALAISIWQAGLTVGLQLSPWFAFTTLVAYALLEYLGHRNGPQ